EADRCADEKRQRHCGDNPTRRPRQPGSLRAGPPPQHDDGQCYGGEKIEIVEERPAPPLSEGEQWQTRQKCRQRYAGKKPHERAPPCERDEKREAAKGIGDERTADPGEEQDRRDNSYDTARSSARRQAVLRLRRNLERIVGRSRRASPEPARSRKVALPPRPTVVDDEANRPFPRPIPQTVGTVGVLKHTVHRHG